MLVCISPAKSLDWQDRPGLDTTKPDFGKEALSLAKTARNLSLGDLKKLMSISDDLARLNRDRFKAYATDPTDNVTRPAALAFNGDTYQGLEASTLGADEMIYAQ
ncbi:MAG: peroxide stress protein YaaA, partial [Pseudomonadota bacterium]